MRKVRNHHGGGWSYLLADPSDLGELPGDVAKLLSAEEALLFEDFPESISTLAREATFLPLGAWLLSLVGTRCELEVHRPTRGLRPSTVLRFHHSEPPGGWAPGIELSARKPPVVAAPGCPSALAEVYRLVGGIDTEYGGSGRLVGPADTVSAAHLIEETNRATPPEFREFSFYGDPADYPGRDLDNSMSIWEADGDVLFWTPDGDTFWLGNEHFSGAAGASAGPVDDVLTRLFEALVAQTRFCAD